VAGVSRLLLLALLATGLCGCPSTPSPSSPSDQQIYSELVEAGCMKEDDSGLDAVTRERALNPPKAWMNCLSGGGTVSACGVPCTPMPRP
jgi:hypothetical protein